MTEKEREPAYTVLPAGKFDIPLKYSTIKTMKTGEKYTTVSEKTPFSAMVDAACERLQDRQVQYSLRRLHEMEENLAGLERELEAFLLHKDGNTR